ncbi:MAG: MazG nucleotide pyrophosphohydrolase domain-containing protein [Corynebacterium sp.]|nr:MazG nucleotide pyrophosphohydrolase domain-containing protein [Corynebacterium sp.]
MVQEQPLRKTAVQQATVHQPPAQPWDAATQPLGAGDSIVLLDSRWPSQVPVEWLAQLRGKIVYDASLHAAAVAPLAALIPSAEGKILATTQDSVQLWQQRYPQAAVREVPSRADAIAQAQRIISAAWELGQWEQQQTHHSLLPYLSEEAAEVAQAIEQEEGDAQLCAELGDLLLQVLFHAEIAQRRGAFGFSDVAASFVAKMARRAPYLVDGSRQPVNVEEQEALWQAAKQQEKP